MGIKNMQGTSSYIEYIGERGNLKRHSCRGCRHYIDGVCLERNIIMSRYSDNNAKKCTVYSSRIIGENIKDKSRDIIKENVTENFVKKKKKINISNLSVIDNIKIIYDKELKCKKCNKELIETEVLLKYYNRAMYGSFDLKRVVVSKCICCKDIMFSLDQYKIAKKKLKKHYVAVVENIRVGTVKWVETK